MHPPCRDPSKLTECYSFGSYYLVTGLAQVVIWWCLWLCMTSLPVLHSYPPHNKYCFSASGSNAIHHVITIRVLTVEAGVGKKVFQFLYSEMKNEDIHERVTQKYEDADCPVFLTYTNCPECNEILYHPKINPPKSYQEPQMARAFLSTVVVFITKRIMRLFRVSDSTRKIRS